MFVDEASITARGGDGGNGCTSFRREKYVPRGGPNGGDGGHGGSVVLVATHGVNTLLQFRQRSLFRAPSGRHGEGSNKTGRSGLDLELPVPVGTLVLDEDGVRCMADLSSPGDRYAAAPGGRGGRGNARFATSTRRAPARSEEGRTGAERKFRLELKLLADVGLVGFPNAGKSTLISRISAARPRIADYPFTTLEPHLGVVDRGDYRSFVVADIPGLIEGAHEGAGLGHRFLRHVERCRLLLVLIDVTDASREPVAGLRALELELFRYRPELADRPSIIVVTKADALPDGNSNPAVSALARHAEELDRPFYLISAVSGHGLSDLVHGIGSRLDSLPRETEVDPWDDDTDTQS
jgi:GTP-binding protein